MRVSDFDFDLPEERIALRPAEPRESARLLVIQSENLADNQIGDLPDLLRTDDVLVFNDTRVIPAQLFGLRERDGNLARVEGDAAHARQRGWLAGFPETRQARQTGRPHPFWPR